ncbi:hypothetical protein DM02DRAFT_612192 [Periconia macrospinosa]|uniref:DUF7730 domain-containing protein n=1 Tax=Periconia macrospinosa TaxID=97972 RepID=A0A2V1E0A0_9PLEO|nr:hypothetical protein DM02DRAFT_612192 [Periconia macrospinosa]
MAATVLYARFGGTRLLTDKELARDEAKEAPQPLPKRRQSLSLPRPQRRLFHKTPTKITEQTGSLFRTLPIELRILIFEFVFGGSKTDALHIFNSTVTTSRARIRHRQCAQQCNQLYTSPPPVSPISDPDRTICPWCSLTNISLPISTHPGLGLLLSCRQAYIEGINLLYTLPTFTFFAPIMFMYFRSILLPQRLARVTSVRIHWHLGFLLPARYSPRTVEERDILDLRRHYDPCIEMMVSDKMPALRKLGISVVWELVGGIEAQDCLWVGLETCKKFELLKLTVWSSKGALPLSDLGRRLTKPVSHM